MALPVQKFSCFWRDPSIPAQYSCALPTTSYYNDVIMTSL